MHKIGENILRLDAAAPTRKGGVDISLAAGNEARRPRQCAVLFYDLITAARLGARVIPRNFELFTPFESGPCPLRIDSDTGRNLLDIDDARHRKRCGIIESCNTRAEA